MSKSTRVRRAVGAVLRERRVQRDKSQDAIGLEADLHRTYVGSVERGERNIAVEALASWLKALHWSWQEFGKALDRAEER